MEAGNKLLYLYCVTGRESEFCSHTSNHGMEEPYFVHCQGLYAVVSDVKESEFGEVNFKKNLADMDWIKTKASLHETVIEEVMKNTCVIPFKFGTIFNSEDSLKKMLKEHIEEFRERLEYLEGREEWGIKIYCDREKLKGTITKEDDGIRQIDEQIDSSSAGKAYLLKKKKDELVISGINERINTYGQDSFEILKKLSIEARINKLLPREVTEREDDMILNAAFLVDKNRVAEFVPAVESLKARYSGKGIDLDCSGPWPAYNFMTSAPTERTFEVK